MTKSSESRVSRRRAPTPVQTPETRACIAIAKFAAAILKAHKSATHLKGSPAILTSRRLQAAYDLFNRELFAGELPGAMIVLHRARGAYGYCWTGALTSDRTAIVDEIALNPEYVRTRPALATLSTLAHEMAHQWVRQQGDRIKQPASGYHCKAWAAKMRDIGLMPSDTAAPGGKQTGPRVSHYVPYAGSFYWLAHQLIETGWTLDVGHREVTAKQAALIAIGTLAATKRATAKRASKTKFTCPECNQNAWGAPSLAIVCARCEVHMHP
jgi:hypothetical protein